MGKAFIQESTLTDIADAIRSKNGSNDTYLPSEMADAISNILVTIEEKEVNFYDWEGTLLYSYTKAEFAELSVLPTPPDRTSENLTQEGWNLTKQDIIDRINLGWDYVAVGCTYHTTDGKTYMTIEPDEFHPTVYLSLQADVANDVTVNWGDGNSVTLDSTSTTDLSHTYSSSLFGGVITLTIECVTSGYSFVYIVEGTNNKGKSKITSINLSGKEKYFSTTYSASTYRGFSYMYFLEKISLSNPSETKFGYSTFAYCCNLKHCNIPKNFIPVNTFMYCDTIKRISIPCTIRGYFCFKDCFQLDKSYVYINVYSGIFQSIARIYDNNYLIEKFIINEGPALTETYVAYQCKNLKQVELPSTINNITYFTFSTNINLESIYIKATVVPTLPSAFTAPNTFYKIYVPRASCAAYKAATNWSTIADHIYPYDYTAIPDALYFYMPNGGDVTLTKTGSPTEVTLEYSTDCGTTWTTWTESNNVRTLTLTAGETMFIRNTSETSTGFSLDSTDVTNTYRFSFTNTVYAGGPLESLICKNPYNATLTDHTFRTLFFNQTNLVSAPTILSTNIPYRAYMRTFYNTRITSCDLSNTTNVGNDGCYEIFRGCSNLNNVRCGFTSIDTDALTNWMYGVAATGDFYCPSTLTIPTDSASGIPSGWTRHDID